MFCARQYPEQKRFAFPFLPSAFFGCPASSVTRALRDERRGPKQVTQVFSDTVTPYSSSNVSSNSSGGKSFEPNKARSSFSTSRLSLDPRSRQTASICGNLSTGKATSLTTTPNPDVRPVFPIGVPLGNINTFRIARSLCAMVLSLRSSPGGHSKPASHGHLKTGHLDSSLVG